jgi:sterol desaturase/sphingolipid hydroxylase (fatty acid hydroxylase superfamily)
MPFTVSHPAIVLPLKRFRPGWFSLTGLMSGAMAPDLQYFLLADTTHRGLSHSWTGLFLVDLPLGLIFAFAFHRLFKSVFVEHLPSPLDRTLSGLAESEFSPSGLRQWVVLIISILVGVLSHFFWDSFTHTGGVLAQRIPWLLEQSTILGITRHNTRWVQHVSSIFGAVAMIVGLWKWKLLPPQAKEPSEQTRVRKVVFWLVGSGCGLIVAVAAVWFYNRLYEWHLETGHSFGLGFQSFGLGSWAGFFYFVCVYSLLRQRRRH